MIDLLSSMDGQFYHITAMLHPSASEASLENALRGWFARVDHFYLGRNWSRAGDDRADGIVFFETRPHVHAHIVMRPPKGSSGFHFQQNAGFFFVPHPEREMRHLYPKPVTTSGKMLIQRIGPNPADLFRVSGYAAKDMEWRSDAPVRWKFVCGLEPAKSD
jgi:hypothetical protein